MRKKEDKQWFIIDISVGLDINVTKNLNQKRDKKTYHLQQNYNVFIIN